LFRLAVFNIIGSPVHGQQTHVSNRFKSWEGRRGLNGYGLTA
jgi:hypothetical protein